MQTAIYSQGYQKRLKASFSFLAVKIPVFYVFCVENPILQLWYEVYNEGIIKSSYLHLIRLPPFLLAAGKSSLLFHVQSFGV